MYDVTIIGAGPAGISAALYAKRANLNVLVLYFGESNLEQASKIDNYYGFVDGISGKDLFKDGIKQAENLGVEVKKLEVLGIEPTSETFKVKTENEIFETKTVIIATGNRKVKPNIKGIKEFEGKGISYCAICDAFFYRNKNVAIIGNGKFAVNEATELSHVANKVTILTNGLEKPECEFEVNTKIISAIKGENIATEVEFEDGSKMPIDGVFVALGEAGASDFAKTLGIMQEGDNINTNEKMETNVPGIYACGNITGGLLQVCKAVYEGAEAGLAATNFVRTEVEK
ncbi:MAG: NAD(P)/FAD-dependent oxidoreductase [Clostridia bacterium]|nr:NAD(P)/FAD-dependent oxidoreductase [Clostridia bacterium]